MWWHHTLFDAIQAYILLFGEANALTTVLIWRNENRVRPCSGSSWWVTGNDRTGIFSTEPNRTESEKPFYRTEPNRILVTEPNRTTLNFFLTKYFSKNSSKAPINMFRIILKVCEKGFKNLHWNRYNFRGIIEKRWLKKLDFWPFFEQKIRWFGQNFPPNRTEPNHRKNTEPPNRTEPNRTFGRFLVSNYKNYNTLPIFQVSNVHPFTPIRKEQSGKFPETDSPISWRPHCDIHLTERMFSDTFHREFRTLPWWWRVSPWWWRVSPWWWVNKWSWEK